MPITTGSRNDDPGRGFVRLILVTPFLDYARDRGIDAAGVLRRLDLDEASVRDPGKLVHAEVIYGLLDALSAAAGDPHLGFNVGVHQPLQDWPPFQRSVAQAATLGEFLSLFMAALPREANSVRFRLVVAGEDADFAIERQFEPRVSPQHSEAFGIAHFLRLFRAAAGATWDPGAVTVRTCFPRAIPARPFGAAVELRAAGTTEICFPAAWLFRPVDYRPSLHAAAGRRPAAATGADVSVIHAFRSAARPLLDRIDLRLDDVAVALGLDPVRLARALKEAGTSGPREIRQLRMDEAKAALAGDDSVAAVAARLGYSDPSHFARFFRSQLGQSPRDFRKALRAGASQRHSTA